jgi:hypothetical protein
MGMRQRVALMEGVAWSCPHVVCGSFGNPNPIHDRRALVTMTMRLQKRMAVQRMSRLWWRNDDVDPPRAKSASSWTML